MFTNRLCQRLAMSVCGISLLFSCNKPAIEPNLVNQALEVPAVVDGKLAFSTLNSFGDYLKKNANPKTKTESNARKDFHSYNENQHRHIAGRMEKQEIEEEDTTYIPDSNLASVLNKKREVTIGKLVYKFGSDYTFVYLPSDTALIHQFYQDLKRKAIEVPEKQLFIYKEKLSVAKTDQVLYEENKPISNGRIDASITKEDWFNNDEKVIAEVWSSSYFFYSSCGTKTFAQKKYRKRFLWTSKDAWANENAARLTVKTYAYGAFLLSQFSNNVKVNYRAGAYQIEAENTVTNDSNCERQIASLTGFGVAKFNLWNIESYHTGQKYGITKSLYINGSL